MEDINHIIEGCKKQELPYQEKLYTQLYPALYALCKSFFQDPHDVLTALNNGMLRVFKNIKQYDASKGIFFNWAYTIVRHAALTLVRDRNNHLTFELNDKLVEPADSNPFKKLEWKDIYVHLDQLPATTRSVCSLHYLEGFSIDEIADALGIKDGTVKWHLHECRNRLKIIFDNHNLRNIG